jgi:hypothetical protein
LSYCPIKKEERGNKKLREEEKGRGKNKMAGNER